MTNWTQNITWFIGLILVIFVLMLEKVFGPPMIFLWIFGLLIGKLKLDARLWITVMLASLSLAIIYGLSFGISSSVIALQTVVAHQTHRLTRFWLVASSLVLSGFITWQANLNISYYGGWCLVVTVLGLGWWLGLNRQKTQKVWMDKWSIES